MRICHLDLESTGTNPHEDRIVEIAMQWQEPGSMIADALVTRVNPGVPIPAEASAIHGITDADVSSAPRFSQIARKVQLVVQEAVIVGYCCRTFDTVMLDAELRRAGMAGLVRDSAGRIAAPEIDLYQLWLRHEDRKLVTAARRFAGVDLEDAHSAGADMQVLPAVLAGMCEAFGLDRSDTARLCELSVPDGAIDRDGKFRKREDGVVVFAFGKHLGQPAESEPGFLSWMLTKDFSDETKSVASALLRPCPA